jgi:peptidoglycan/xylan/chitin deacetylase (PgdA/CDA1 family)
MKSALFLWYLAILLCVLTCAAPETGAAQGAQLVMVAVTVDDLPASGDLPPGISREQIIRAVIKTLKDNHIPQVYGFANGRDIGREPALLDVLKEWLRAGYPLGNHSYSHLDLNKVTVTAYTADIERMDHLLQTLAPLSPLIEQRWVYRYPYLDEGETLAKRDAVRDYLFQHGYRISPVTIDFYDWAWDDAYTRCLSQNDRKSVARLKADVADAAIRQLRGAEAISRLLFGHNIPQILLLHDCLFESLTLNRTLERLRADGVKFVSLDTVLADPAYRINPNQGSAVGLTLLEQIAAARNIDIDKLEATPYTIDRLNQVCRGQPTLSPR